MVEYEPDFASKLYRSDNGHFVNVSDEAGILSNVLTFGLGVAISDYNNDGWPDIFVSNDFNEPDYLFINNKNNNVYYREQMPVRGFQSSVDPVLNFGIGNNDVADSVIVLWPNDKMQKLVQVKANQTLVAKFGAANQNWMPDTVSAAQKLFTATSSLNFTHKENEFNDFTVHHNHSAD
ncbi:MAG: CRTAC1 family protein [Chitinophagaceae bacterium]|nr:CRTAC1 family protein [Chitinophagaceae bacterium]